MALLRSNCTVSTSRNAVSKLENVRAQRDDPRLNYTLEGQAVETLYTVGGVPIWVALPGGGGGTLDLEEGDMLTENGRPAGVVKLVMPWNTGITSTDILVSRAAT